MALKTFKKGIHPSEFKELTEAKALEELPLPKEVILPLQQHIGAPAKPVVKPRDQVKAGQVVAESVGFVSVPIHTPISGKVKEIGFFPHPIGAPCTAIHIVGNKEDPPP